MYLCFFVATTNCVVYINRVTKEVDSKFGDIKIVYTHNAKGDSVTNATFMTLCNITKMMVYMKLAVPENKNDREYKRELVRTVIDAEKIYKGSHSNFLVKIFFDCVLKYADFEFKLPLAPVVILSNLFKEFSIIFFITGNVQIRQHHRGLIASSFCARFSRRYVLSHADKGSWKIKASVCGTIFDLRWI